MITFRDITEQSRIEAALLFLAEGQLHLVSDMIPMVRCKGLWRMRSQDWKCVMHKFSGSFFPWTFILASTWD